MIFNLNMKMYQVNLISFFLNAQVQCIQSYNRILTFSLTFVFLNLRSNIDTNKKRRKSLYISLFFSNNLFIIVTFFQSII